MLDFLIIQQKNPKRDLIEISPKFVIKPRTSDLMIRGRDFYAVWNSETKMWSTNEEDVIEQVDRELDKYKEKLYIPEGTRVKVNYMWDSDSGSIDKWHKYVQKQMRDCYHVLDNKIIFSNSDSRKTDYASKKLNYPIEPGDYSAFDEIIGTLYEPEEREKLEWSIGSIISGDSKKIQKFVVLYGTAGSGKSTILNIIQMLFEGYYSIFDAKELASNNNSFALESFKNNPLVSIQHDGDLSRIEDNTKINSIVSHETMEINEKFKSKYTAKFNSFLFMGTNKPVRITEAKSGIIRRLIDVQPSGKKISYKRYQELMNRIPFELGAIADRCLNVYESLGKYYYDDYIPTEMISSTNDFYDFMENYYDDFKEKDAIVLREAWDLYKKYCDYANIQYPYNMRAVRVELKNYFRDFEEQTVINGQHVRNLYSGFIKEKFQYNKKNKRREENKDLCSESGSYSDSVEVTVGNETECKIGDGGWLIFKENIKSEFDEVCGDYKAQYASAKETPQKAWDKVTTKLSDLDTSRLHYICVPLNHIVIDFDLKDENGNKDLNRNIEAASKFPPTYAELSKSGSGIHLHYIYGGDPEELSRIYDEGIEIKVFTGKSALRRKLTKCNALTISVISSGLPLLEGGGKKMIDHTVIKNEKQLRAKIIKGLERKVWDNTAPSVSYIYKVMEDAYASGIHYDVSDMRQDILAFAMQSHNQKDKCIQMVNEMKFKSDESADPVDYEGEAPIIFYDVEVFPNLFVLNWKYQGKDNKVVRMINPKPVEVEELFKYRLVGFNNRRYDNHILYARSMGYSNEELFHRSQAIINDKGTDQLFNEAYNLSYTDVYDFCSKKQSLKKWEIDLGIHHQELGLPWDEPVPEELWEKVAEYCDNDVIATEAVFDARHEDFVARQILAELSGLTVNDTTNKHTTQLIVGNDKHPQDKFVYTDLSTIFPGYIFENGKSYYKGFEVGEGGFVYAEPGMYVNVETDDVAGMHPASARRLNVFGDEYTKNFGDIVDARLAIKHKDFEAAGKMFGGKLKKFLVDEKQAKALAYALKIAVNSVYGLTAAGFDNRLRDPRNKDNIVAKYGALFMINLKEEVEKRGFKVIHIKTDSIKISNPTDEIREFIFNYGKQYGFTFEIEARYEKFCLVNKAVYIAKEEGVEEHNGWTATGEQFAHPYIFKSLFSKEPIEFEDYCETKSVTSAIYIDMNEDLEEGCHNYIFVGKVGNFCPIKSGCGGGILLRQGNTPDKYNSVGGTKGYRWLESEIVKHNHKEADIDKSYYVDLMNKAIKDISVYGDYEWFVSDEKVNMADFMNIPEEVTGDSIPF